MNSFVFGALDGELMAAVMKHMISGLGTLEALRWFFLPACVQWFVLQETRTHSRSLRWLTLAPLTVVLCAFCAVLSVCMLLVGCGLLLFTLLFQENFFPALLDILKYIFGSDEVRCFAARAGLFLAGWGSAWALDSWRNSVGGCHETTNPSL